MSFSLIVDRWLQCRRASGARVWLAPHEIASDFAEDPVVALDFPRPDWNAAVTELMIGLVSTAVPPDAPKAWTENFQRTAGLLVEGAKVAASALKYELRRSKFAKRDGDGFKLLDTAPKDAFDEVATAFWPETERAFVETLEQLRPSDARDDDLALRIAFRLTLRGAALRLFDDATDIDTLADQDAKRLVATRQSLVITVSDSGRVAAALRLVAQKAGGAKGKGKKP